jgi:endoglucanase
VDSRALWTDFVARQAEARGMSWAYWEFCSGFGVYDKVRNKWNGQILDALIPPGG